MRVGIVGCGIRGQLFASALEVVAGVTVVGMADPSQPARAAAQERLGEGIAFESDYAALYRSEIDAAVIATPDFAHLAPAVAAAERGLHLLIEKPLATSTGDATEIERAVAKRGVMCLVAFENRWNPHFIKLKRLIAAGQLGEIVSVQGTLSNSYFVPEKMLSWSASSSPAWFLMPHTLDLAMWLSDSAPRDVTGRAHRGVLAARGTDTWDHIDALVEMESGVIANLRSSWILPDTSPHIVDFRVEVIGTLGSARIDMNEQGIRTHLDRTASHWALPETIDGVDEGMAQWMARAWARGLLEERSVGPDATHGRIVTQTIETLHDDLARRHSAKK